MKKHSNYGIKHCLLTGLLLAGFSTAAMADFKEYKETKSYVGLGVTGYKVKIKESTQYFGDSEKFSGGTLRLGMSVNDYLSLEGRYSFSKKRTYDDNSSAKLSNVISGLVLIGPNKGKYRPYLAAGVSSISINLKNAAAVKTKAREISPALGVGFALYTRKPDVGLSFEYLHLAESKFEYKSAGAKAKQKTSMGALSITVLKHF